ncbi:hypothetical protein [Homoserinimonas sp. A520]
MTKTILASLTLAAVLTIGLGACAPTTATAPVDTKTAAPAAPDPLDLDGNGSVSEFEKQMAAQNAQREFIMPDGSTAKLDPREPTPAAVIEVLAQQAQPIGDQYKRNTDFSPESIGALHQKLLSMAESQAEAIGRPVVILFSSPDGAGGTQWIAMPSSGKSTGIRAEPNRDSMLTKVQSWANSRGYEVVVLN